MSVRIVCVVCGIEHGPPDGRPLQGVCEHESCVALDEAKDLTDFTVTALFDKAARRATYVQNLQEEDSDEDARLAISRFARARKRAMYAVAKQRGDA